MKNKIIKALLFMICMLFCFSVLFSCKNDSEDDDGIYDDNSQTDVEDEKNDNSDTGEGSHLWELKYNFTPTCQISGCEIYVCSICNEEKRVNLPVTNDHSLGEEYEMTANQHYKICSVCDKAIGVENHSYENECCTVCGCFEEYYEISLWVQNGYMATDLFAKQVKEFADANKLTINLTISERDGTVAGNDIINDPTCAPDIFCFTQKELQGLIDAEAIMPLSTAAADNIKATHCHGAVLASSENGILYGYPMAITERVAVLYYDKSLISEDDAKSLEKIIDICEKNNKFFRFQLSSGWGVEHFFFSTGCESRWTVNKNFEFVALDDNYNSNAGIAAMKGLAKLAGSSAFNDKTYGYNYGNDTAVIISEINNRWTAENTFGENLGVAIMPSFTVDGENYQMKSVGNTFLMGISPTEDSEKAELLSRLALWLSDEECQLERFENFMWCPTNIAAQTSEKIESDPYRKIQIQQYNISVPERHKNLYWSTIAGDLYLDAKEAKTDEEIIAALNRYDERVALLFEKGEYS